MGCNNLMSYNTNTIGLVKRGTKEKIGFVARTKVKMTTEGFTTNICMK